MGADHLGLGTDGGWVLGCHHDLPLGATKARWVRAGKAGSGKSPVVGGLGESVYLQVRPFRLPFYLPSVCLEYKKQFILQRCLGTPCSFSGLRRRWLSLDGKPLTQKRELAQLSAQSSM